MAGVAALLLSAPVTPALSNDDVDGVLKATARPLGDSVPNPVFGHGLVRADDALRLIMPPHGVIHQSITPTVYAKIDSVEMAFMNVPCISTGRNTLEDFQVAVYEMLGHATFVDSALAVWTRGRHSIGWRDFRTDWFRSGIGRDGRAVGNWVEIVPGSMSATGCDLRAYTYKFYRNGAFVGWFPINAVTGIPTCSSAGAGRFSYAYVVDDSEAKSAPPRGDTQFRVATRRGLHEVRCTIGNRKALDAVVYDVTGRAVRRLLPGPQAQGSSG